MIFTLTVAVTSAWLLPLAGGDFAALIIPNHLADPVGLRNDIKLYTAQGTFEGTETVSGFLSFRNKLSTARDPLQPEFRAAHFADTRDPILLDPETLWPTGTQPDAPAPISFQTKEFRNAFPLFTVAQIPRIGVAVLIMAENTRKLAAKDIFRMAFDKVTVCDFGGNQPGVVNIPNIAGAPSTAIREFSVLTDTNHAQMQFLVGYGTAAQTGITKGEPKGPNVVIAPKESRFTVGTDDGDYLCGFDLSDDPFGGVGNDLLDGHGGNGFLTGDDGNDLARGALYKTPCRVRRAMTIWKAAMGKTGCARRLALTFCPAQVGKTGQAALAGPMRSFYPRPALPGSAASATPFRILLQTMML